MFKFKLFIIWSVFLTNSFSQDMYYFSSEFKMPNVFNVLSSKNTKFAYFTDQDQVSIFYSGKDDIPCALVLYKQQRQVLRSYIDKYFEWNKTAIQKKIKTQKNIGDLSITFVYQKYYPASKDWSVCTNLNLSLTFFSQNEIKHQFLIQIPEASPKGTGELEKAFMQIDAHDLYFDYDDAIKLKTGLDQSFIDSKVNKTKNDQDELESKPSKQKLNQSNPSQNSLDIEKQFEKFWNEFRIALIKGQKTKLISMTSFPFYIFSFESFDIENQKVINKLDKNQFTKNLDYSYRKPFKFDQAFEESLDCFDINFYQSFESGSTKSAIPESDDFSEKIKEENGIVEVYSKEYSSHGSLGYLYFGLINNKFYFIALSNNFRQ